MLVVSACILFAIQIWFISGSSVAVLFWIWEGLLYRYFAVIVSYIYLDSNFAITVITIFIIIILYFPILK